MKASILVICLLVFPAFATAEGTDVQSVVSTLPLDDIQRAFDGAAAAAEGVGPLLERALSGESLLDLEAAWQDILRHGARTSRSPGGLKPAQHSAKKHWAK